MKEALITMIGVILVGIYARICEHKTGKKLIDEILKKFERS